MAVKKEKWWAYVKPNNKMYDGFWGKNGVESFEAGYVRIDKLKPVEKIVLSRECDSFGTGMTLNGKGIMMDFLKGGYIRFWSMSSGNAHWENELAVSTCILGEGEPNIESVLAMGCRKEKIR